MKVSEIMTREVLYAAPDCPLDEAIRLFETHGFRHLPVVESGRLIGMISDRDVALATGWILSSYRSSEDGNGPQTVGEVMKTGIRCLPDHATVNQAAALMLDDRISALPLLNDRLLVGLITTTDLLRTCRVDDPGFDWKIRPDATVSAWMSKEVRTIDPDMQMFDALDVCKDGAVRHLPVIEGGKLVGMVSDRDLRFGLGQEIASDMVAQGEGRMELTQTPISALMTTEVVTIGSKALLSEAADKMLERGFSALPVVDGDELVGIITQTDILRSCC
jgi:CBS domain-containing protein